MTTDARARNLSLKMRYIPPVAHQDAFRMFHLAASPSHPSMKKRADSSITLASNIDKATLAKQHWQSNIGTATLAKPCMCSARDCHHFQKQSEWQSGQQSAFSIQPLHCVFDCCPSLYLAFRQAPQWLRQHPQRPLLPAPPLPRQTASRLALIVVVVLSLFSLLSLLLLFYLIEACIQHSSCIVVVGICMQISAVIRKAG